MLDNPRENRSGAHAPIGALPHYWRDEAGRRKFVDRLFDGTAGEYDFVERLLGLGRGPRYRRDALRRAGLAPGMQVLDIATGTGLVAREAIELVGSHGSVLGLDPSAGMLERARELDIGLVRSLGERLPFPEATFDFVSMGFALRHVADMEQLFREIRRVLRPGGTACILELTRPEGKIAAASMKAFMTRVVPVVARMAGRAGAGDLMRFYWDTIDACVPPSAVLAALEAAGFPRPRRVVTIGMFSEYVARKAPGSN
jgi:demethylmenaquinone methyltransferase / 2-methoxy-6-polyprenyl-1,4-benzoquinol methylase